MILDITLTALQTRENKGWEAAAGVEMRGSKGAGLGWCPVEWRQVAGLEAIAQKW